MPSASSSSAADGANVSVLAAVAKLTEAPPPPMSRYRQRSGSIHGHELVSAASGGYDRKSLLELGPQPPVRRGSHSGVVQPTPSFASASASHGSFRHAHGGMAAVPETVMEDDEEQAPE